MTEIEFLTELIASALPTFAGNITDANGSTLDDFLDVKATVRPSAFVSYEGFAQTEITMQGKTEEADELFSVYLRTDDNIVGYVKELRKKLLTLKSRYKDADGQEKYVRMTSGKAFRDDGSDAFEISVVIS